ncbi:MAG TPA: lamin tail domain-containing protein [Methylomirabilota bacterium]|nr:lamin tail domain-containing protein [Methylomirabilota bacterium]
MVRLFFAFVGLSWLALSPASNAQLRSSVTKVGTIEMTNIIESSGLMLSKQYPGVLWTHNDTGSDAFLFAMSTNGARLGAFEVQDVRIIDWEALGADTNGNLYIADIGTNGMYRTHSAVHLVREPEPYKRWGPVDIQHTWLIRFPGERPECESFFVHGGYGYVITKFPVRGGVQMYRFPLSAPDMESILLEHVASIAVGAAVSDASLTDDNSRLALVTDRGVYVLFIDGNPATAGTAPREFVGLANASMEGGTWVGESVYVTSEASLDILAFGSPFFTGAPVFTAALTDQFAFVGGSALFFANVRGFPNPTFIWLFNGEVLTGRTGPRLSLGNLSLTNSGIYEVIVSNINGVARSNARLTVTEQTNRLRITEVMSSPAPAATPVADWWELTNFDTNVVDISGWRFNDSTGDLTDAFVIPNGVTLRPDESIIFVENLTPDEFRAWWGATNIPPGTRIITYTGAALSFRVTGDSLRLWSNTAQHPNDVEARVDFGQAEVGVTFTYDPATDTFGARSQLGVNGAFRAASGVDIGSPGRVRGGSPPSFTTTLTDQFATVGGTLTLSAVAIGTPAPRFEWRFNGTLIEGATNAQLTLRDLALTNAGVYSLTAINELGTAVTSAQVTVVANTTDVRITEVMSSEAVGTAPTADWWELTSFDTESIDLSGWRFNDSTGDLADAFVIPAGVTIAPNETIIFVENLSAQEFRAWWGATNIPASTQIITYTGAALSFRVSGDSLRLWDSTAQNTNDLVTRVDFGQADVGVSFAYDPATQVFGIKSQAGVNGAVRAVTGPDVGSPGRVAGGQPRFTSWVTDRAVGEGGTVTFTAQVVGSPEPALQWLFEEAPIAGATNASLTLANVTIAQAGTYTLVASNALGTARSSAELIVVQDAPQVRITEVMSSQAAGGGEREDWWELTSLDDQPIDLSGWRFNDSTGGLADAFTIPAGTSLRPGESIVFVENLTAAEFRAWWGETNVPTGTQIVTYTGAALSFRVTGDSVRLWDDEATADNQVITRVDFGQADVGISFVHDPATGAFGKKSQAGVEGAVRAQTAPDVGSPGRYAGTAGGLQLSVSLESGRMVIRFFGVAGREYLLQSANDLSESWKSPVGQITATTTGEQEFIPEESEPARFYRVQVR